MPALGVKTKKVVLRILVIFQNRPMLSHINKALAETYKMMELDTGLS